MVFVFHSACGAADGRNHDDTISPPGFRRRAVVDALDQPVFHRGLRMPVILPVMKSGRNQSLLALRLVPGLLTALACVNF